ncbi:MAG: glycerophosphodiester phosphodiesterase family protein [Pseudomonadota bacterium]
MTKFDWLGAKPVAHRGLHQPENGIIENTISAIVAASRAGFAVEIDVQVTKDGEAVCFHDETLDRLTSETGLVSDRTLCELTKIPIKDAIDGDKIPSLAMVLKEIGGATPIYIELKSKFDDDTTIAKAVMKTIKNYRGPVALMSFDPRFFEILEDGRPSYAVGQVSYRHDDEEALNLNPLFRLLRRFCFPAFQHDLDFVAYNAEHLPEFGPRLFRLRGKVLSWTVRSEEKWDEISPFAQQMIFEGFIPKLRPNRL